MKVKGLLSFKSPYETNKRPESHTKWSDFASARAEWPESHAKSVMVSRPLGVSIRDSRMAGKTCQRHKFSRFR